MADESFPVALGNPKKPVHLEKTTALTKDIAERSAELGSTGYQAWVKAREESDFSKFAPLLEQWVDLLKEKCHLIDPSRPVYDVCLDDYERGLTAPRLDKVFSEVRPKRHTHPSH
eukprot:1195178-Prorocentrum_minimum.AAC.4